MDANNGVVTNGPVVNTSTSDITPQIQTPVSDATYNGSQSTTQVSQQPTTEQPANRDAYFQSNWDKLATTFKEEGLELKPDMDFKQVFNPYINAHKAMQRMDKDPNLILELAKEYFPDQIIKPDYASMVKTALDKEFGPDFEFDSSEAFIVGTPSWNYRIRQDQVIRNHETQQREQQYKQQVEQEQRARQTQEQFSKQYELAKADLKLPEETLNRYVQTMSDPKYFNLGNIIKVMMLNDGLLRVVPNENGQGFDGPTSVAPITGSKTSYDKDITEFAGIFR